MGFLSKILQAGSNKQVKEYQKIVERVNALSDDYRSLSDTELKEKHLALAKKAYDEEYEKGKQNIETTIEACALIRELSDRRLGKRLYDVQIIGALALNDGHVAEAKTGEGKTVMSFLAAYRNTLSGHQVHVITVNDYLTERDAAECGKLLEPLGIKVGRVYNQQPPSDKAETYESDIIYGTPSEFGFDYLRDAMAQSPDGQFQKEHYYAIIDEADSVLIDEARTPLIISNMGNASDDIYSQFAAAVKNLKCDVDFTMEEDKRQISLTEEGLEKVEKILGIDDLYSDLSGSLSNYMLQALKAQFLFHRDKDYIVADGEVKIVDEFTGRIMEGRRWSDGLHQAIEAKEHVKIQNESQTLATVTLQNYFRLYDKLAGMTGTAMTEDAEFRKTYEMGVVAIPTNKPMIRVDEDDLIYRDTAAKYKAIAAEIQKRHETGQPCLVGTVSVENSEKLSRMLSKIGIKHEVLNAKNHKREAEIVAQAGRLGAVTIATNMAGRGTDIMLGGNVEGLEKLFLSENTKIDEDGSPVPSTEEEITAAHKKAQDIYEEEHDKVVAAGGLAIIGTERHESRRIDNQLRGRAGRQGDPGHSQFFISLEDDLMRLFGNDRMDKIAGIMEKSDIPEDFPLQASLVSKSIENAQRQVENMNFEIRKQVLEYDDVMNQQRLSIYKERNEILRTDDLSEKVEKIIDETVWNGLNDFCPENVANDDWDWESIKLWYTDLTGDVNTQFIDRAHDLDFDDLSDTVKSHITSMYEMKRSHLRAKEFSFLEHVVLLKSIDSIWVLHLTEMDYLKRGIGLRSFGQKDPLTEYKNEAYDAFATIIEKIYYNYLHVMLHVVVKIDEVPASSGIQNTALEFNTSDGPFSSSTAARTYTQNLTNADVDRPKPIHAMVSTNLNPDGTFKQSKDEQFADVGRNDLCPCGSGLKFKKCCGKSI